jgi:hypothetical protein
MLIQVKKNHPYAFIIYVLLNMWFKLKKASRGAVSFLEEQACRDLPHIHIKTDEGVNLNNDKVLINQNNLKHVKTLKEIKKWKNSIITYQTDINIFGMNKGNYLSWYPGKEFDS